MCWQIGGDRCIHPDVLARHLSERQLAGWLAWSNKRPRGEAAENVRLALLRHDVRGQYREGSEDVADLMPFIEPEPELPAEVAAVVDDFFSCNVPKLGG